MRILIFLFVVSFLPCKSQSLFHSLLTEQGTQFNAPAMMYDNITATSAQLFWEDVNADNYILQQDAVQIYSGTDLNDVATSLTAGTYSFRIKAQKSGFADSPWTTLSVTIPTFYATASMGVGDKADLGTRQVDLEPSVAGADRARSYSGWVFLSKVNNPSANQYIFNTYSTAFQMAVYHVGAVNNTSANCERLRFGIYNGANFIEAQGTTRIIPGNWYHIVCTYSGSETFAGLKIYVNGVLESLTNTGGGTYTGALNDAAIRFIVGQDSAPNREPLGGFRDVCVWATELDQTEIDEMYNGGVVLDPASLSFYVDIVANFPMQANTNCINNATFNLGNDGVTFMDAAIKTDLDHLGQLRTTIGNTRYVAFGGSYVTGTKINTYVRSGTSHIAGGRIDKIQYDIPTRVASAPATVITDGTYSMSGVSAGEIDGDVSVFSTRYDVGGDTFIDSREYVSTDGTTGDAFDTGTTFTTSYTRFEFMPRVVHADGKIVQPYFGHNGTNFRISLFVSTDNGASWTKEDIYDDTALQLVEPTAVFADGVWLVLCRRNDTPFGIYQIYSTDDMATWSSPVVTNLGSTGTDRSNVDIELTSVGTMQIAIMDRGVEYMKLSKNNRMADIIADPTAYTTPLLFSKGYSTDPYGILGYPNLNRITGETYFLTYSSEQGASRADAFYGFGKLNEPN